ncbi:MAG: glycosyltransferase [Phycisphaerales bacterium]|nr:glycosyltransferase [Phycisphaerales bacterium]
MLIVLPSHLRVSGVTTWAMRAIDALRSRSVHAGIIAHTRVGEPIPDFLRPYLVAEIKDEHPIAEYNGRIETLIPHYRRAIESVYAQTDAPVVLAPCLHGDCFGVIAALTQSIPEKIRLVSWLHADNGYDLGVGTHYESIIHGYAAVSRELGESCKRRLVHRAADITHIRHSIPVSADIESDAREPYSRSRPIRIVYTGRIEEHQKRVSALPWIARRLHTLGMAYEFRIVGNGEAMDELRKNTRSLPNIKLVGAVDPDKVADYLRWGDAWVLASRYEGQSVAMLEAMSCGCVPIVARVHSGVGDAISHEENGIIVEAHGNDDGEVVGHAIGNAIAGCEPDHLGIMRRKGIEHVRKHHSPNAHGETLESLVNKVRLMPARLWAADRPAAFSSSSGSARGSGSTPADGSERMRSTLRALAGKRIAIYGAGRHSIDLAGELSGFDGEICCAIDDNPQRWGGKFLGWEICSIDDLERFGVSDVVISSWIHEDQLAARCVKRLADSIGVHRLYAVIQAPKPLESSEHARA